MIAIVEPGREWSKRTLSHAAPAVATVLGVSVPDLMGVP